MAKRSHTRSNPTNTHRVVAKGNVDSANTPPPPPPPVKEDEDETEQVTIPTESKSEDKPVEPEQEPEPKPDKPEHEHSPLEGVLETVQDQEATRQRLAREKDLIDKLWALSEQEDLTGDVNLASVSEAIARNYEVIKANEKDLEGVYIKVYELSKNKALEMMLKRMENGRHLTFAKKSGWKHGEGNRFMDWVQKQKGWQGKRSAQRDMRMWENRHVVVKWIALNPNEYLNTSKADELFTAVENGRHLIFADSSGMFRKNLIDENTGRIKQEYYTAEGKLDDKKLAENRDKNIAFL